MASIAKEKPFEHNKEELLKPILDKLPFLLEDSDIKQEVLKAALNLAVEIAREGREGKAVGTAFVIGDSENVMKHSRQLILNPFAGSIYTSVILCTAQLPVLL